MPEQSKPAALTGRTAAIEEVGSASGLISITANLPPEKMQAGISAMLALGQSASVSLRGNSDTIISAISKLGPDVDVVSAQISLKKAAVGPSKETSLRGVHRLFDLRSVVAFGACERLVNNAERASLVIDLLKWCAGSRVPVTTIPAVPAESDLKWLSSRKIDSLHDLRSGHFSKYQSLYDRVWKIQRDCAREIVQALLADGIDVTVLKGAELQSRWFDDRAINLMADIDLLVQRSDLQAAKAVFYSRGYRQQAPDNERQCLIDRDIAAIAEVEARHYELAPFSIQIELSLTSSELEVARKIQAHPLWIWNDRAVVIVEFDVHHGIATDVDATELLSCRQKSALGVGQALSDTTNLWFTIGRYYSEVALHGKRSLRDLAFICPLAVRGSIDWDRLILDAARYELRPPLYYLLTFVSELSGGHIPEDALAALSPDRGSRLRDWGWLIPSLLELVEPFPRIIPVGTP
jgi:hypothetical protein